MSLCYPTFALEDVLSRLERQQVTHAAHPEQQQANSATILGHLLTLPLQVAVQLGTATITVKELLQLRVGDVLRLDTQTTDLLMLFIQEQPKLWVRPGSVTGRRAVQIVRPIDPSEIM
ncbi:MAG: FliM/FliN family flagellar motor switch protein [Candidatus Kapabacteria bacterium]|nr:FliM/FliN family flagellar motor switch protein [Candidatus Kapabacteria bacterium]